MRKRILSIVILIFVCLFSFNIDVKADDLPDYFFSVNIEDAKESNLYDMMCTDANSCVTVCRNGDVAYNLEMASSKCDEDNPIDYFYLKSFSDDSGKYDSNNNIFGLKKKLREVNCNGNDSCLSYVTGSYCKNKADLHLCSVLNKNAGENGSDNDNSKTCYMELRTRGGSNDVIKMKLYYAENKPLIFEPDDGANHLDVTVGNDSFYSTANRNKFYLRSKANGSTFDKFSDMYGKKLRENNNRCPSVTFCYDNKVDSYFTWYAEFGECDSALYVGGASQTIGSDGSSDNIVFSGSETHYRPIGDPTTGLIIDCDTLFKGDGESEEIKDFLKTAINIVKITIPILLIVLGSIDMAQAIFAQDDAGIKKAQGKFIRRLIIGVVIFLIPSMLKLILTIAHGIWDNIDADFCGILYVIFRNMFL